MTLWLPDWHISSLEIAHPGNKVQTPVPSPTATGSVIGDRLKNCLSLSAAVEDVSPTPGPVPARNFLGAPGHADKAVPSRMASSHKNRGHLYAH